MRRVLALVVFLLLTAAAAVFGSQFEPGAWHAALDKPPWHPPNSVFGPVWTLLYLMIAVAGWRVYERCRGATRQAALTLWLAQLVLNALWSWLFFGLHQPWLAFGEMLVLLLAIGAFVVVTWSHERLAALLFLPYAAWVAFATALTAAIAAMN